MHEGSNVALIDAIEWLDEIELTLFFICLDLNFLFPLMKKLDHLLDLLILQTEKEKKKNGKSVHLKNLDCKHFWQDSIKTKNRNVQGVKGYRLMNGFSVNGIFVIWGGG